MSSRLNRTEEYHRGDLDTLGWELTVCNSLEDPRSPCRRILKHPASFGEALYRHLETVFNIDAIESVLEVGGGYGCLMAEFTRLNRRIRPVMLDISPALLDVQRRALEGTGAVFIGGDVFGMDADFFRHFEFAVLNENCGDFPTACGIPGDFGGAGDELGEEIRRDFERYGFEAPVGREFNYNIGAVRALELLCRAGVPNIYMSEHSCEASPPDDLAVFLDIRAQGNPEAIRLKGHVEYTVRFSHLEKVARYYGYEVRRGPFAEFLPVDFTPEVNFILRSGVSTKDEHEIIRQFIGDLYKYEYLAMKKNQ